MTRTATPRRSHAASSVQVGPASGRWLVHGVVSAGTTPCDPEIEVITHGDVAGLVRRPAPQSTRWARRALLAHADLLDRIAATGAVLPLRFGTVVPSREGVERDLLVPYHDAFAAALVTLAGRAQFTVRAKYLSDAILLEVLERDPGTRRLHQRMRAQRNAPDHGDRVALGEKVAQAIMATREADATVLADSFGKYATLASVQVPSSVEGYRIADAAFLVDLDRRALFEETAERLARRWRDRARVRLLGPMAAYHFADRLIYGPIEGR